MSKWYTTNVNRTSLPLGHFGGPLPGGNLGTGLRLHFISRLHFGTCPFEGLSPTDLERLQTSFFGLGFLQESADWLRFAHLGFALAEIINYFYIIISNTIIYYC